MKATYLAGESDLRRMIDRWLEGREVIGPRKTAWGDVLLEPLESGTDGEFDFELQVASPKEWVLPQMEDLFTYEVGGEATVHLPPEAAEQILFAIRSCDMSGLSRLDEAMAAEPADYYYLRRRRKTTCIVLACERVFEDHFCHLLQTGPSLESGFDWQLTRLGEEYAVEIGSERGQELAESVKDLLRATGERDEAALRERHDEARRSGSKFADLLKVREALAAADAKSAVWTDLASRCQGCGGCSFVCPTCSCFSISDVRTEGVGGSRQRQWDSCAFSAFTDMAGVQCQSDPKLARVHRRLYHKHSGGSGGAGRAAGCVGCGRCVEVCTGNSKLRDVLASISSEKAEP
jgi:ferredoxin